MRNVNLSVDLSGNNGDRDTWMETLNSQDFFSTSCLGVDWEKTLLAWAAGWMGCIDSE